MRSNAVRGYLQSRIFWRLVVLPHLIIVLTRVFNETGLLPFLLTSTVAIAAWAYWLPPAKLFGEPAFKFQEGVAPATLSGWLYSALFYSAVALLIYAANRRFGRPREP